MKESIKGIGNFIATSYQEGFLFIARALVIFRYIYKNPMRKSFIGIHPNKHVWAIGICFLVAGLRILYSKITGQ